MTRKEDIRQAIDLGVDAIGLIFYPGSSRCLSVASAKKLLEAIPPFLSVVAVLVNPEVSKVNEIIAELPIGWLQFHGNESPAFCEQFGKPYIKAIAALSTRSIEKACLEYPHAAAILVDTPSVNHGGTGKTFDWALIPKTLTKPLILAGGLQPENVAYAVNECSAYAVDVCSGVESSAGIKDQEKMRRFVSALWG